MFFRLRLIVAVCLIAVFAFALRPLTSLAQTGATVQGNVIDPDDALIPGANVTLTPAKGNALTAVSQSDGTYTFKSVPPGIYSLTASASGFGSFVKLGVRITGAQALTQDIKMSLQEQSQVVQVTTNTAQVSVDSDSNASATVIKGKDLEALSDDPDELSSELTALAGPAAGPSGGQIYVDGFTGGQLPPKSSIREIRVNQNPFSAQYDKIGFGRVEVFTKPGTDKFHGNASIQGNDNNFNTSNPFLGSTNVANPYHTIFFLGSLTGPINHSTSFTLSGSRRQIQDNSIINPTSFYASSADSTTLCAPGDLSCSLIPSGYPTTARAVFVPRTRWDISPRLDYALTEKNTITARYQYESNATQNDGLSGSTALPSTAYNDSSTESTLQVSDSQIISAKVINETRFEYQRSTSNQNPVSQAPTVSVQGNFSGGGSSQGAFSTTGNHIEGQNYTSIALSKNFIRFGGRVRYNSENLTSLAGINGTFTYNFLLDPCVSQGSVAATKSCVNTTQICSNANLTANNGSYYSSYQCGLASQYNITKINQANILANTTDVGLYVEDDWKPKANLSISYGLRFEAQTGINSAHDFAPRLSVSYGIPRKAGNPVTVVRGGFGIFYDRFTLGNILTTFQNNGTNQVTSTLLNPGLGCQPDLTTTGGSAGCSTGPVTSRSNINTLAPDLRSAYNIQAQAGVDQQLGRSATISVNYIHTQGDHEFFSRSLPSSTNFIYQYGSGGVFRQNQLFVNGNIRAKFGSLFGFYGLSGANSNTGGASSFLSNPNNPAQDYGRAAFNRKNFAVMGGNATAPYKISLSPFMIFQGGSPYNVTTGTDVNQDSISNDRPAFNPSVAPNCKDSSTFLTPAQGTSYTPIPINYCTAPSVFTFNLRIARTFGFGPKTDAAKAAASGGGDGGPRGGRGGPGGGGRGGPGGGGPGGGGPFGGFTNTGRKYNLTFGVQGSNIFNVIPYGTPVGQLTSTRFGQSTNIATGPFASGSAVRRITLQATFNF